MPRGLRMIFSDLIHTLNQIEIRGEENLDMMSGCIKTVKQLYGMVQTETVEIQPEPERTAEAEGVREDEAENEPKQNI